jgi:ATP-dependent Clp protease ATP-binding subunit ClpA
MMPEHLTPQARAVSRRAYDHARRLGHRYIGGEHFLLALSAADHPVGAVLRERGVTPERVEEEIGRLAGGGLFGDLDRSALAVIGIDVDAVRARIEASFGQDALTRADQAVRRRPGASWWDPRRVVVAGVQRDGVFLPFSPGARQTVVSARTAAARRGVQIGVEHLALGLITADDGLAPAILAAVGALPAALRAAILARYRQAS